ncbi:hypothetical protein [Rhizobium sp. YS-1r]|uniref:Uncharacterized protein n=1 Tax=Neorhizobium phenanthreniclasticum TaxID=3157917 RepID=A0ABV0MB01_9HYPH|nr:hypothetical protein [Rhizobium sp. YS-1r]
MVDDGKLNNGEGPANDNRPPDGQESGGKADASERLDAVVLSIARLVGRQMAREDFAARTAANDNRAANADRPESAEDDEG